MAVIRPLAEADWPQVHNLVIEVATAGETAFRRPDASYADVHVMYLDLEADRW